MYYALANFPQQTSYRNPVVAEALKALGYIDEPAGDSTGSQSEEDGSDG